MEDTRECYIVVSRSYSYDDNCYCLENGYDGPFHVYDDIEDAEEACRELTRAAWRGYHTEEYYSNGLVDLDEHAVEVVFGEQQKELFRSKDSWIVPYDATDKQLDDLTALVGNPFCEVLTTALYSSNRAIRDKHVLSTPAVGNRNIIRTGD